MQPYPQIKRFVQRTLGCSCPEHVFRNIRCRQGEHGDGCTRITVGDRLLIYLVRADEGRDIGRMIGAAMRQGVGERDHSGLNRFRLVLVTPHPDAVSADAEAAFAASGCVDERTHLHIVRPAEVSDLE